MLGSILGQKMMLLEHKMSNTLWIKTCIFMLNWMKLQNWNLANCRSRGGYKWIQTQFSNHQYNTPYLPLVIDRYENFHLTNTDTDMLIITYTDTDKKKTNSPIPMPIPIWKIVRYWYQYWYRYYNFLTKLPLMRTRNSLIWVKK